MLDHLSKNFVLEELLPTLAEERLSYTIESTIILIGKYMTFPVTLHIRETSRIVILSPLQHQTSSVYRSLPAYLEGCPFLYEQRTDYQICSSGDHANAQPS